MKNSWRDESAGQLVVCSRSAVVEMEAALPAAGRIVVARLDGTRMTDADHAFYEFSDTLFLPGYFGWNWAALSDCLCDLSWLPAEGYLIAVDNAPRLLSDSAQDRYTLLRTLSLAVHHWASVLGRPDDKGVPFKVLLLCDTDEEATALRQETAYSLREGS